MMLFGIGTQELLFIALIVLLFFGGKKIPELMKGLGKGVRSFKDGMKEVETDLDSNATTPTAKDSTSATREDATSRPTGEAKKG